MHVPADIVNRAVEVRRKLHAQPELSNEERETRDKVLEELSDLGFEIQPKGATQGIVAVWPGEDRSKAVGLRADMDALPIQESSGKGWASRVKNVMHACGHDGHTSVLIGLARALSALRKRYRWDVKLIWQPAEETGNGAVAMIKEGVMKSPEVKAVFAMHAWPSIPQGSAGVHAGAMMASVDNFSIRVIGKGGHGAQPHRTQDPVVVGAQLVTLAQSLITRQVNPSEAVVLTFGQISAGNTYNVIPGQCDLKGTLRTQNDQVRRQVKASLERLVHSLCQGFDMKVEFRWLEECPATVNHPGMADLVRKAIETALGPQRFVDEPPSLAGEDFSFFLKEAPGAYFWLGVGDAQGPLHNPRFDFNDQSMEAGIRILLQILEDYFSAEGA